MNKILDPQSREFNWDGLKWEVDKPKPPVLNPRSAEYFLANDELQKLQIELRTATKEEKASIIYRMQGHYHQPNMTEQLIKAVASDYARLLDGYPAAVMQEAVDSFLLDPEHKFFPKVGEIKKRIDDLLYMKKRRYQKLSMLVNGPGDIRQ